MLFKSKSIDLTDFHFEHKQWLRELRFWKDELITFKNRLEEVVQRWDDKDVLAQVEHFQNQFIRHDEVLDIAIHDVNAHEHNLTILARETEKTTDFTFIDKHVKLRDDIDTQRHIYNELKQAFFSFLIQTK